MTGSGRVSRRDMLRLATATVGAVAAGAAMTVPALAQRARQTAPGPNPAASTVRTRRPVHTMQTDDPMLVSYRRAVTEMQRRSRANPNDPTGWTAQANIHANRCPHSSWYFFPWHRGYLLAFEEICRQASGDSSFALPYWDWTQKQAIPEPFADPGGAGNPNPLLNTTRDANANAQIAALSEIQREFITNILRLPEFDTFGGRMIRNQTADTRIDWQIAGRQGGRPGGQEGELEGGPHNNVHGAIGGVMGGYTSPLDPIFWLHHCNVDRLWVVWNQCSVGGVKRVNTTNPLWLNYAFNFGGKADFVTPDGRPRVFTVRDLQKVNPLGYSYGNGGTDAGCPGVADPQQRLAKLDVDWVQRSRSIPVNREVRSSAPASFPLPTPAPSPARSVAKGAPRRAASGPSRDVSLPASGQIPTRVVAVFTGIEYPKDTDTVLRVFVNNKGANPSTPSTDPSHVGTISFFGGDHGAGPAGAAAGNADHGPHKKDVILDLTRALQAMKAAGRLPVGDLEVQVVPVSRKGGPSKDVGVSIEKIDIAANRASLPPGGPG